MNEQITNVGQLREALADFPDDAELFSQVSAGEDHWMMQLTGGLIPGSVPEKFVLTMRHPNLVGLKAAEDG